MRIRRVLRALLVSGVVATGSVAVFATPASAACGSACDGKDPSTYTLYDPATDTPYHCAADARTIDSTPGVELRYSPRCATAWARASGFNYFYVERNSPHRVEDGYGNGTSQYTRMVNSSGTPKVRACYHPAYSSDSCTAYH